MRRTVATVSDVERVLLGLNPPVQIDGSTGSAVFSPEPEHRGAPGWVHGGLAATVLDHTCARVASAVLESKVATGTLDLRYRQPLMLDGGPYKVTAVAGPTGTRSVRVTGRIHQGDRVFVEAKALFVGVRH